MVVDPWGNVLGEMDEKPGCMVTEIDLREVKRIREELPLLTARQPRIYQI